VLGKVSASVDSEVEAFAAIPVTLYRVLEHHARLALQVRAKIRIDLALEVLLLQLILQFGYIKAGNRLVRFQLLSVLLEP